MRASDLRVQEMFLASVHRTCRETEAELRAVLSSSRRALKEAQGEAGHLRRIVHVAVAQCESICNDGSNRFATHCANLVLGAATLEATNIANLRAASRSTSDPETT